MVILDPPIKLQGPVSFYVLELILAGFVTVMVMYMK